MKTTDARYVSAPIRAGKEILLRLARARLITAQGNEIAPTSGGLRAADLTGENLAAKLWFARFPSDKHLWVNLPPETFAQLKA